MPQYKLVYFDLPGRAEPIRMLFHLAGVKFIDHRIPKEEFPAMKPTLPYGQLPVLYVDNQVLAQATTIGRYLGNKFGLAGENEWEKAKMDELVDSVNDMAQEWTKFHFAPDEQKKEEAKKHLLTTVLPKYLGKLNMMQNENGGSFLVGKSVSWADVCTVTVLDKLDTVEKNILNGYPHLRKLKEAFYALPQIKAYVEKK